jgi:hypothetical protein
VQEIFGDSLHATANASQDEKEENGENELAALGGCYTLFHNCYTLVPVGIHILDHTNLVLWLWLVR